SLSGRSCTSSAPASRPRAAGPRTRPRSSTGRRSTSFPRTTATGSGTCAGGSPSPELPPSTFRTRGCSCADSLSGYRREVGRGDVAGDLVDVFDRVPAEIVRVVPDNVLVGRVVHAERHHFPVLVDHDVAVLPDDLRVAALDDLAGAAPNLGHLVLADVELPHHHVSRHEISSQPAGLMFWFT